MRTLDSLDLIVQDVPAVAAFFRDVYMQADGLVPIAEAANLSLPAGLLAFLAAARAVLQLLA